MLSLRLWVLELVVAAASADAVTEVKVMETKKGQVADVAIAEGASVGAGCCCCCCCCF